LRSPKGGSAARLTTSLPSFQNFKAQLGNPQQPLPDESFRARLETAILATAISNQATIGPDDPESEIKATPEIHQATTKILCAQWRLMIRRAQESISESSAPLTGDVNDISEVLQRKHDFEKLKRQLSALNASISRIPAAAGTLSPHLAELKAFESSLESWAIQLEKVSQSLLGLLAVSESKRATEQAVRSKNLQLLAFVFIPISTVSSIYGMNTIEILSSPPKNWSFAVGAILAIAASALAVALYDTSFVTALMQRLGQWMQCCLTTRIRSKGSVAMAATAAPVTQPSRSEIRAEKRRARRAKQARCTVM
jgi:hypothetical protein